MMARATLLIRRRTVDLCSAKGATRCSAVHTSVAIWLVSPSKLATQGSQTLLPDGTDVPASVAYL